MRVDAGFERDGAGEGLGRTFPRRETWSRERWSTARLQEELAQRNQG